MKNGEKSEFIEKVQRQPMTAADSERRKEVREGTSARAEEEARSRLGFQAPAFKFRPTP